MRPFSDGDVFATFSNIIKNVTQEIQSLNNDYVLKASPSQLEEYYINKALIEPIQLMSDQYYIESKSQTKIDVSWDHRRAIFSSEKAYVQGTRLNIAVPYSGDKGLWQIQPSTYSLSGYPDVIVYDDRIILTVEYADDDSNPDSIKTGIIRNMQSLSSAVTNLNNDVSRHNTSVPQQVKEAIARKRKLAMESNQAIEALGIPMKKRDEPLSYTVPLVRKNISVEKPKVSTEPYKSEPFLNESDYSDILKIMKSMSLVIERNPEAFKTLDEEAIRTHFLLQLNGHYKGNATGETFNASGKTDILIREGDRNIFIAECKFWKGQKSFNDAIDQLLGYLTWRDTKCALLVFNKTKDSETVRLKLIEVMEKRSEYLKTIFHNQDGDSRYIFIKKDEPGKEIIITTQIYDIPN